MDKNDLKQITEIVKDLATKDDLKAFATKDDLKQAVSSGINEALTEFWTGNLEPAFNDVHEKLDVIQTKLDKALYTEVVHLEARIKRLEDKVGITHQAK